MTYFINGNLDFGTPLTHFDNYLPHYIWEPHISEIKWHLSYSALFCLATCPQVSYMLLQMAGYPFDG